MIKSDKYWRELAQRIEDPVQTKNKRPDTSDLEIQFLREHLTENDNILDVGSGSGLIVNKLVNYVGHITAVEKFEGFSKFIVEHPNMLVINSDLLHFNMRKQFDAVLSFGVSQCFNTEDAAGIYERLFQMTKTGGKMIVRTHCGLHADKVINGFSEELGTEYFAEYRLVANEIRLMEQAGFRFVSQHDIFPDTLNVWPDTRHFIFICEKD
jgi:cyclopropane fatty-acyl-phospholipid synthase-like methyltransferase